MLKDVDIANFQKFIHADDDRSSSLGKPEDVTHQGSEGEMDVAEDEPWEGFGGEHSGNNAMQTRRNHIQGRKQRNFRLAKN